jgi:predicted ester cyclase
MSAKQTVQAFIDAFQAGDFDTASSMLSNDFQFSGPVPEPIGAQEWMGMASSMRVAFPDINYNFEVLGADESKVKVSSQLTGTHTGDLDLSPMGMGVIPPTGKPFSNAREEGEATVRGGKIVSVAYPSTEGAGLMALLAQLGIQPPG